MPDVDRDDLALIERAAGEAGRIAMRWWREDPKVWMKEGDSPVSEADIAVDEYLKETLLDARPDYGWLSEETEDDPQRRLGQRTFIVDPIDGTRGFIQGARNWCVSIAVVEKNRPVAGVLCSPPLERTITAKGGAGTFDNGTRVRFGSRSPGPISVTGPRVFMESATRILDRSTVRSPFVPSLAWRLAMVACNEVDVAFARSSARDWDLAAADLIVHEAGAVLTDAGAAPLSYNCPSTRHGVLVACGPTQHEAMLDVARRVIEEAKT